MKHSRLAHDLGVTSANLIAEDAPGLLIPRTNLLAQRASSLFVSRVHLRSHGSKATVHLAADGSKFTAHLLAELRNLQRQVIDAGRQFFEDRHASLPAFLPV